MEKHGINMEGGDLNAVIQTHDKEIKKLPASDFKRLFWEQQVAL